MPNIIQIQDDLKNLPDQVLVNYVQNPTGTMQGIAGYAPSYLVLAELQRRTDMRNRYAAQQQQPEKTVSDKIVEEATPMQNAQRLMGGVGALPAGNIGENYGEGITTETYPMPEEPPVERMAGGGIVAFQNGGMSLGNFGYDLENTGITYDPLADMPVIEGASEDEPVVIAGNPYYPYSADAARVPYMPKQPQIQEYKAEDKLFKEAMGVSPAEDFYKGETEAIDTELASYVADEKEMMNMAFIKAGLGMAGGTSPFALTNVAQGALPAVEGYIKDKKDLKREKRLLNKEKRAINRLERAERLGDVKGFREYAKEIRGTQLELMKQHYDYLGKLAATEAAKGTKQGKAMEVAIQESIKEMEKRYPEGSVTPFMHDAQAWEKERKKIQEQFYNEILSGTINPTVVERTGTQTYGKKPTTNPALVTPAQPSLSSFEINKG